MAPKNPREFEQEIDASVVDGLANDVDPEQMLETLDAYRERVEEAV